MITVEVYCQGTLLSLELSVDMVIPYIELVKKFGYEDEDLEQYEFNRASVSPEGVTIYLDSA